MTDENNFEVSDTLAAWNIFAGGEGGMELDGHASVVERVLTENLRQLKKWGNQDHRPPIEWVLIELEELAEVAQETNELHFGRVPKDEIMETAARLYKEWVEVAAVAVSAARAIRTQMEMMDGMVEDKAEENTPTPSTKSS